MHHEPEFDQFAQEYHAIIDHSLHATGETSEYFARLKAEKLAQWLPHLVNAPLAILDFGCGDGAMTNFVSQTFTKAAMFGVDPSSKSIDVAAQKYPHISFGVSTDTIPFADARFDIVTAAGVFHHIPFHQHKNYYDEVFRVLKPGGTFVMFELNPLNPGTRYIFKRSPVDQNARMLTPWYAKDMLKQHGATRTNFYAFFPHALKKLRFMERLFTKVPFGGLYASLTTKR